MSKHSVMRELREIKNQLSYSKNIGFFFGAGSSCALGIPNVDQLTLEIENSLDTKNKTSFITLKKDLESHSGGNRINIENVLNQVRRIREITAESKDKNYLGVDGESAKELDNVICKKIYQIIFDKEKVAKLDATKKFLAWFSMQNRDTTKEIFTTNYDLIFERALEEARIPYFDGFVGSYEPFFWQESIEKFTSKLDLTQRWIRLWKIHGSLSWFWRKNDKTGSHKVVRVGKIEKIENESTELVIYPSKEKYDSSRKQPFIAYFDRLKNYLLNGELLFVFNGYSFSDQHINEVVFNCLRQNNRLHIWVFFYTDAELENFFKISSSFLNVTAIGPGKAIVNGALADWELKDDEIKPNESVESFWDKDGKKITLGDFTKLVNFLVVHSGRKESVEAVLNEY